MGCISSKVMARSLSYQQEMKWGSQGMAKRTPALPEDMLVPRNGSNHFLALVCAATTLTESPILVAETEDNDAIVKSHLGPVIDSQETSQPSQGNASLVGESNASSETIKEVFQGDSSPGTESNDKKEQKLSIKEDTPQERPVPLKVKGFKRKSVARGLNALDIPSTIELPAIASLREWLPEGQVFSPGADPTPKFGSYTGLTDNITNKSSGEIIFDDELVIVLEEQLQHLKAEEEAILKQITSTWKVSESTGVQGRDCHHLGKNI